MTARRPRLVALGVMIAILAAISWATVWLLLRPEQLRRRVLALAERSVDGHVEIDGVRLRLLSRGRITRAVFRPRGEGAAPPAGELTVLNLIVEHSPAALLIGRYQPLRVSVDEMTCSVEDPARFLEMFRGILEPAGASAAAASLERPGAPPPPITIERLTILYSGGPIPLTSTPTARGDGVVLEHVVIRPERSRAPGADGGESRRFDVHATYRAGPLQTLEVGGIVDLGAGVLRLEVRASNLDLRGRQLEGISPEVGRWFGELGPSGPIDLRMTVAVPWRRAAAASSGAARREEPLVTGDVEAYDVSLAPRGFARPITHVSGRVGFDGTRLTIESLRGVYGKGEVRAHGKVEGSADGTGVELELDGKGLELADLAALPLPAPYGEAIAALDLDGRGDVRLSIASAPGETLRRSRFRGELAVQGASAYGGAFEDMTARTWFAGEAVPAGAGQVAGGPAPGASAHAVGSVRIDHAELRGVPLRGVIAELTIGRQRIELRNGQGRLADGTFRGSASLGGRSAGAPLQVDLAGRAVQLGPIASAFYGRSVALDGAATGTLTLAREPGQTGLDARADASLAGVDPSALPAYAGLGAALAAEGLAPPRFPAGHLTVEVHASGAGRTSFALVAPGCEVAGALEFDATRNVTGTATAGRRTFALSGPLAEPVATTASARPAPGRPR